MERRTHEDWDSRRLNTLAIEYMELRKEIWEPLAVKIGERWSVVEAKVGPQTNPVKDIAKPVLVYGKGAQKLAVDCTRSSEKFYTQ